MRDGEPVASSAAAASSPTYRCFLFADLRGYTSFVERAGNAAGAELLDEYLAIARAAVAQHHGAEIKTEGDGFHAVFPSASSAVTCGLTMVELAAQANARRAERPIRVGVGVHAGEALETPDGFVGSAVNVAARVCAAAAEGEVLVTDTVRGITQASVAVRFVPRGRTRLKGIAEPVELFAVVPPDAPVRARRRESVTRPVLAAGALAAVAGLVGLGLIVAGLPGGPSASPETSPQPAQIGPLSLGQFVAADFQPPFRFLISDPDWSLYRHGAATVGLLHEGDVRGRLDVARIEAIFTEACQPAGPALFTGSSPTDLVDALGNVPYLEVEAAEPLQLGEHAGLSVDLTVAAGALAACSGFGTGDVALFGMGEDQWRADPEERFRLLALAVGQGTVAILLSSEGAPASSVVEVEAFYELAGRVIETLRF